jgi:hypothetical protein
MTTAQPAAGAALRLVSDPTYARARCQNCRQAILREASWSITLGRVALHAGAPWIHASTGDPECPLTVDLIAAVEITLDGITEEAEVGPALSTRDAAVRIIDVLAAREALRAPGTDWQAFTRDLLDGSPEALARHLPAAARDRFLRDYGRVQAEIARDLGDDK